MRRLLETFMKQAAVDAEEQPKASPHSPLPAPSNSIKYLDLYHSPYGLSWSGLEMVHGQNTDRV